MADITNCLLFASPRKGVSAFLKTKFLLTSPHVLQPWAAVNVFVTNSLKLLALPPPLKVTSFDQLFLKNFFLISPKKSVLNLSKMLKVWVEPFLKDYDVVSSQGPSSGKQGHSYCFPLRNTIHLLSVLIVIRLGLCGNPFERRLYLSLCSVLHIQSGHTVRDVYLSNYGHSYSWLQCWLQLWPSSRLIDFSVFQVSPPVKILTYLNRNTRRLNQ